MGSCSLLLLVGLLAFAHSQTVHKMAIRSDIRFRFATTEVTCIMGNPEDKAKELFFDFTLPKDAFISNFSMEIEGEVYHGEVKEKGKARKQYLEAKETGSTGGLVEQSTRHSNKFDVSVNIAAGGNVTFRLLYQELLRRRYGAYEHSIFLDPKHEIQDYSVEVHIQELTEIQDVQTPALRKDIINNDVEEGANLWTQITYPGATSAHIVYNPSQEHGSGWFVVKYDVDAKESGELLVVDGYFVHFFLPPDDLPPLPLDIVFVLDRSGSMDGRKLQQLKDAMSIILDDLRASDRFNILFFDGSIERWQQELQNASTENREIAAQYVKAVQDRGSTNLHKALMEGLKMLQGSRENSRIPMIFFLTDGEATAGEQNSDRIVSDVSRKNEGVVSIYSLAFGDGADYKLLRQISAKNKGFARKIYEASDAAKQVTGLYREISTVVIHHLTIAYESSSNKDGDDMQELIAVDNSTITTCVFPTLFGRSDLVVAGKLENSDILNINPDKAGGLRMKISGQAASGEVSYIYEEQNLSQLQLNGGDSSFWTVPRDLSRITERTWAFLTIQQMIEEKVAADASRTKELDQKILDLSLKYHFVTPLTSMVVTRPKDDINKGKENAEASLLDADEVKAYKTSAYTGQQTRRRMQKAYMLGHHTPLSSRQMHASVPQHTPADYDDLLYGVPGSAVSAGQFLTKPMSLPSFTHGTTMRPFFFHRTTTTTRTPPLTRKKSRKGKRKSNKRKGSGRKQCVRNKKVLLESVTASDEHTTVMCYELKAPRKANNYTILADPVTEFSLTVGLSKKLVKSLVISQNNISSSVHVNEAGELYITDVSGPQIPNMKSIELRYNHGLVSVRATRHKCKATAISVDIKLFAADADASVIKMFQGFTAKAFKADMKKNKRTKRMVKGKKKKRKTLVAKKCLASNIPADRSRVLRGKMLLRFKA